MVRYPWRTAALVVVLAASAWFAPSAARAERPARYREPGDLFYNFYTDPGYGGISAEMYLSPRPTPPLVGHTYITYQPLMPNEFLYQHRRTYRSMHEDGTCTTTRVRWGWNRCLQEAPHMAPSATTAPSVKSCKHP